MSTAGTCGRFSERHGGRSVGRRYGGGIGKGPSESGPPAWLGGGERPGTGHAPALDDGRQAGRCECVGGGLGAGEIGTYGSRPSSMWSAADAAAHPGIPRARHRQLPVPGRLSSRRAIGSRLSRPCFAACRLLLLSMWTPARSTGPPATPCA